MSQTHSILIDRWISAPGHGKEVVDGLNDVVNTCFFLSNDINRLLCAVVVAASCLLSSDKKESNTSCRGRTQEVEPWT